MLSQIAGNIAAELDPDFFELIGLQKLLVLRIDAVALMVFEVDILFLLLFVYLLVGLDTDLCVEYPPHLLSFVVQIEITVSNLLQVVFVWKPLGLLPIIRRIKPQAA